MIENNDIIREILSWCDIDDITVFARVCKVWNVITASWSFWLSVAHRRGYIGTPYWVYDKEPKKFDLGLGVRMIWLAKSREWIHLHVLFVSRMNKIRNDR